MHVWLPYHQATLAHSQSIPWQQARKENPVASQQQPNAPRLSRNLVRARIVPRAPSLRTAIIVFIAVLVLFRWLHLILALQITSTGQQILNSTEILRKHEREITVLQRIIAEAESPTNLANVATGLGYSPRTPIYLPLAHPLGPPPSSDGADESGGEYYRIMVYAVGILLSAL